ncbi:hypothetical protein N9423_03590 [Alphaproteobacteria bacterium]|nr:hypothetical protein [Alphaproteobacteria bacterium]|tara:strand:+ start:858 stop:1145 length:288 start_codon:yes stop_codon:yes gene_type:complete
MSNEMKNDDVIFNYFKLICDEKDDIKCKALGSDWITAMENNILSMEKDLEESDKIKHAEDIENNKQYLESLKNKSASEWREFATQCMVEIVDNKK